MHFLIKDEQVLLLSICPPDTSHDNRYASVKVLYGLKKTLKEVSGFRGSPKVHISTFNQSLHYLKIYTN